MLRELSVLLQVTRLVGVVTVDDVHLSRFMEFIEVRKAGGGGCGVHKLATKKKDSG